MFNENCELVIGRWLEPALSTFEERGRATPVQAMTAKRTACT
jgi:hypothetical protein